MTRQPHRTLPQNDNLHTQRSRALCALLVLVLVLTPAGIYFYLHRPNLYDRTRIDLVQADREMDIYSQDMELLAKKERDGAEALKDTLTWLRHAAALDPADHAEITAITAELHDWEAQADAGELSPPKLHDRYRALEARVQRLIDKRAHAVSAH